MAASSVLTMRKTTELVVRHEEVAALAMAAEADIPAEEAIWAAAAMGQDRIHSLTVVVDTQLSTATRSRNNPQIKVRTCCREEVVVTPMDRKVKVLSSDGTNT